MIDTWAVHGKDFLDLILGPLEAMAVRLGNFAPRAIAALLLIVIGLVLARGIRTLLEHLGSILKLDERLGLIGLNEVLSRLGMGKSPCLVVAAAAYWAILISFLIAAANAVELTVLTELADRLLKFLPSLAVAIVTGFAGLAVAQFLSSVVEDSARANNLRGGDALARATRVAVWVFTGLMALEQLGLQTTAVLSALQIILASVGLGLALAFGLGGKDIAAEKLREFLGSGSSK